MLLVLRRLKCVYCKQIHHELPDILVPYKRHIAESIENGIKGEVNSVVADESTIKRWQTWFCKIADYFRGCLESIEIKCGSGIVEEKSALSKSKLQRIWHYVGDAPGWLARTVQSIVNQNLWHIPD